MRKAFCTFGVGLYADCLDVSRPTFEKYCEIHGYEYVESYPSLVGRPPAWGKVKLLLQLLESYDIAVWLDCDTMIIDHSEDVASEVPDGTIQAIVSHNFGDYDVPSTGLWYVTSWMIPYLEKIWGMTTYLNHPWWEQRALQELLGYEDDPHTTHKNPRKVHESKLYDNTKFLDESWDSINFANLWIKVKIMHFPAMPVDARVYWMKQWTEESRRKWNNG